MLEIVDKKIIDSAQKNTFNVLVKLFNSSTNYRKWHTDHISCSWEKGHYFQTGSILVTEEHLHGKPHKLKFKIKFSNPPEGFNYKMCFPFSLICPGGSFSIKEANNKIEFIAKLYFRFKSLLILFFNKILGSIKKHMEEEGISIKNIVENNIL